MKQIFITKGANKIPEVEIRKALRRYIKLDWGDLDIEDEKANRNALENGGRILAVYYTEQKKKFYIITEADRDITTILLAEEY